MDAREDWRPLAAEVDRPGPLAPRRRGPGASQASPVVGPAWRWRRGYRPWFSLW
ncbi:MAG: hypothetical protein QOG20_5211 [Pseudonocardiales bacterium]|nr:hypothetical protein [Pseudonocardiales bacterium]